MPAIIQFGEGCLDRAVAAVDGENLRPDAGDRFHRLADLAGVLDLVVEDVGMVGAIFPNSRKLGEIPSRFGVRQ